MLRSPIQQQHISIAVIGGGLTGMATAARLAARGRRVAVFESHRTLGGCSSYFRRSGFAFDVGCTTLVDYRPGGVGGRLLEEIGVHELQGEVPAERRTVGTPGRLVRSGGRTRGDRKGGLLHAHPQRVIELGQVEHAG
ncbi:MAG: FAD-dependent oxidoreductase, partial [Phycisphaerales bacterium]|nr:FAD-dependent oxidoreductase [Phycisphaerales bacterium]